MNFNEYLESFPEFKGRKNPSILKAYKLMYDIVCNEETKYRFVKSCIGKLDRDGLEDDFSNCFPHDVSSEARDEIEQLVNNHIIDDAEFYLVYDKKNDKWMFSLSYDWLDYPGIVINDCKEIGSDYKDCVFDYLDIWKGLDVFIKFCEAVISNDYSWLKENFQARMIPLEQSLQDIG